MFGSKSKIEKLIRKGKWEILSKKYLYGNKETRLMLAKNVVTRILELIAF